MPDAAGAASWSLTLSLQSRKANRFIVTATDAASNASGGRAVPTITQGRR